MEDVDFGADFETPTLVSQGRLNFIHDLRDAWTQAAAELALITGAPVPCPTWKDPSTNAEASAMIERGIAARDAKRAELSAARLAHRTTLPAGRYALLADGEVKCYTVSYGKYGKWAGVQFLARISSDDEYPVRNREEKARILAAVGADVEASARLAAATLRKCRHCGRLLSDTKNPYFEAGYGPECGGRQP